MTWLSTYQFLMGCSLLYSVERETRKVISFMQQSLPLSMLKEAVIVLQNKETVCILS